MTMLCVKPNLFCFPPPQPPKVSYRKRNSYRPLSVEGSLQMEIFEVMKKYTETLAFFKSLTPILTIFGLAYSSFANLYSLSEKYEVGDIVEVSINGVVTICYVKSISFVQTDVVAQSGRWLTIKHFQVETGTISNLTVKGEDGSKFYGILAEFDVGSKTAKELIPKIKAIINENAYVKGCAHNVVSELSNKKISVCCYVPVSKFKESHFQSYLEVRDEVISAVRVAFKSSSPLPLAGFFKLFEVFK